MANTDLEARHLETLDRDLGRFSNIELAASYVSRPLVGTGIALVFMVLAGIAAALLFGQANNAVLVIVATVLGAYMALNIGANDVANNMGPAVGANALTLGGAIAIAAYAISRRFRRDLVGLAIGVVPFLVALYFFFQNVNRLLPPNL